MKRYIYIIIGIFSLVLSGCKDDTVASLFDEAAGIGSGEPVLFATYLPSRPLTRTATEERFNDRMDSFRIVSKDYKFTVEMYEEGVLDAEGRPKALGSAVYEPDTTMTVTGEAATVNYAADGTLKATDGYAPLYWPGNVKKYAFKATAGTATLLTDQSDGTKLLQQDRLVGWGFEPVWDDDLGKPKWDEDTLNYLTSKEWYQANKSCSMAPGYVAQNDQRASEWYKKIPLYMKHQRSMITIRLKAGEGVKREDLSFSNAKNNIETDIYSYVGEACQVLKPLADSAKVDYTSTDTGGEATGVATTQYTAIVEPYDYLSVAKTKVIAEIRLSGQRFTFYASNDALYANYEGGMEDAVTHMHNYDVKAGQHLVITATLGRGSRKILITAYVEDWDETVTASIVDDYGQAGDPIQINTRRELREFLESDRNKAGNVAIIVPNALNLEQEDSVANEWVPQPLHCTLNMAGATFRTNHRVFSDISASGNVVNGIVSVGDGTVDAAVAQSNYGTIERVDVVPKVADGTASTGTATRAGLVIANYGSILSCSSELPVEGEDAVVGGIAAQSLYAEGSSTMPIIDGCTVNARIDGTGTSKGGGIVGEAVGRVTNNDFEYGITIMQEVGNFKNIIYGKADDEHQLRAYGNAWPTVDENKITTGAGGSAVTVDNVNMTPEADRYTGVIDRQAELSILLTDTYNKSANIFRLSNDFTVTRNESAKDKGDGWSWGVKNDVVNSSGSGNLTFRLDGNGKTITTDAMLFSNIMNDVYDLTIRLNDDLIATPDASGDDVIAPLAYSVYAPAGTEVTVSNVRVMGGSHRIQATTAAGLVVWVYGPGTAKLEDCQVKASVLTWVESVGTEAKIFSGGIVAEAARATITRCIYHTVDKTLFRNTATKEQYDGEAVDGNDVSVNIYFGGILGGTAKKGQGDTAEKPNVLITDCTSWFGITNSVQKGAIVGYAQYDDTGLKNGMAEGCEGNWWNTTANAVGTSYNSMTDEQVVGRRNAVTPVADQHFED